MTGKTLPKVRAEIQEFYANNPIYWNELLERLQEIKFKVKNEKDISTFFTLWVDYWNGKNKKIKHPTEIQLHNEIYGDIGKMFKLKLFDFSPAAPQSDIEKALEAACFVLPKRR